jgi:hypothetical protein
MQADIEALKDCNNEIGAAQSRGDRHWPDGVLTTTVVTCIVTLKATGKRYHNPRLFVRGKRASKLLDEVMSPCNARRIAKTRPQFWHNSIGFLPKNGRKAS